MSKKVICMIPARMGSQRLKRKNLQLYRGIPLITFAIRKAKKIKAFDEIWINSENDIFKKIAHDEGVNFHKRPEKLANNHSTSEDFVYEFLEKHICSYIIQLHTIAPLLKVKTIENFIRVLYEGKFDSQFSVVNEQIEYCFSGSPINFSFKIKENSQKLKPLQRISWSITGWNASTYLKAFRDGDCATYSGKRNLFEITREEGLIIKTKEDLKLISVIGDSKAR